MRSWKVLVLAVTAMGSCALAQTPLTPNRAITSDDASRESVWAANAGNEPVGPGDLLYVTVAGSPELSRSYRVGVDGTIVLPMSHNNIHVAGLTADKIGDEVAANLQSEHVLVAPIISVAVLDYRSRQVTVMGAVKQPGVVQAIGNFTVMDAIAKAQGLAPEAGPEAIVTRPGAGSEPSQVTKISLKDLMNGSNAALNMQLRGGDEVDVPEAPKIFVVGNIKMPGSYPVNEIGGTTVLKALALSQGQLAFTTKEAYIYRTVDGHRNEIEVPLRKILHRTAPDMAMQANDILYIPEASGVHLTAAVLDRIASFGGSVGSGLIVFH